MGECEECRGLQETAVFAIRRHIEARGRRELALLEHDHELAMALDDVVRDSAEAREKAVAALRLHLETHKEDGTNELRAKQKGADG